MTGKRRSTSTKNTVAVPPMAVPMLALHMLARLLGWVDYTLTSTRSTRNIGAAAEAERAALRLAAIRTKDALYLAKAVFTCVIFFALTGILVWLRRDDTVNSSCLHLNSFVSYE